MSKQPAVAKTAPTQSGELAPSPSPMTFTGSQNQTTGEMGIGLLKSTNTGPVNSTNTGPVNSANTGPVKSKRGGSAEGDMSQNQNRKKSGEYPSKANTTSTTARSPYPSKKRNARNRKEKKAKLKVTNIADRFKNVIKVLLILVTIVNCSLCSVAVNKAIKNLLDVGSDWFLHEQPRLVSAEKYFIGSTSETCNEMAKEFQTKHNVTMAILSSFMSVCLSLAEPHNSGFGGHSIALYVDAKNDVCKQTQGHYRLPWDLSMMEQALSEGEPNDYWGPFSVGVPGQASTVMGLMQIEDDLLNTTETLHTYFKNYADTSPTMLFPVSSSMGHAIFGSGNDALFTFLKAFKNVRHPETLKVLAAGDLFEAAEGAREGYTYLVGNISMALRMNRSITNAAMDAFEARAKRTKNLFRGMLEGGWKGNETEEFELWKLTEEKGRLIDGKKTVMNGHTVCTANRPTSSSFLIDALKKNEKAYKKYEKLTSEARTEIYDNMFNTLNDTVNMFKDWSKIKGFGLNPSDHNNSTDIKSTLKRISEILKAKKTVRANTLGTYGANMFVIIDVENQKAVSYVASMGDSFGSLLSDVNQNYLLNNFLSGFADIDTVGPVLNSLQPLIATKNKTISLASAGCGGVLTRSLDLARTLGVAVLKLIYDIPIQRAVTIPLIYPHLGNTEYTPSFPWKELNELLKRIETRLFGKKKESKKKFIRSARSDLEVVSQRLDRTIVATSDGKTAEGFYYDQAMAQMLPMGI